MGVRLIIRVCTQAANFDQRYANCGNSYLYMKWVEDGFELYIRKSKKFCEKMLVNKAVMGQLLKKKRLSQLAAIIEAAICMEKGVCIFEQLPDLVQKQRSIIFEKDGSTIVEP